MIYFFSKSKMFISLFISIGHRFIHIHQRPMCTKTSWRYKEELYPWVPSLAKGQFDTAKILATVHDQLALMNCVKYFTSSYFALTLLLYHSWISCGICGFKFRLRRNLDAKRIQSGFFTGAKLVIKSKFYCFCPRTLPHAPPDPPETETLTKTPYLHLKPIWPILGPHVGHQMGCGCCTNHLVRAGSRVFWGPLLLLGWGRYMHPYSVNLSNIYASILSELKKQYLHPTPPVHIMDTQCAQSTSITLSNMHQPRA